MKRLTKILSVFLVAALMFGSVAFASSSDNARVVSAIRGMDSGLANLAEQFLQEDASQGKTLTAEQADQMIAIINASQANYNGAVYGNRAAFESLFAQFTQALSIANISASYTSNGNGIVTVSVYDNETHVTAGFTVGGVQGESGLTNGWVSSTGAVYVGRTAIDNSAFIVAAILGVLAIASTGFIAYRRRSTIA